jgi:hypothetical protein
VGGENLVWDCVSKGPEIKIPEAGYTSGKSIVEATTGFEPVIEVLQTSALPLGHVAGYIKWLADGKRLCKTSHLPSAIHLRTERAMGLEPTTFSLARRRSTN